MFPVLQLASDTLTETTHIGILATVLATAAGVVKVWLKTKKDEQQTRRVEKKLENSWAEERGDDSLVGIAKPNPGRSLPQLIEFIHADLQEHKRETHQRFDKILTDVGKIKGKLDID